MRSPSPIAQFQPNIIHFGWDLVVFIAIEELKAVEGFNLKLFNFPKNLLAKAYIVRNLIQD